MPSLTAAAHQTLEEISRWTGLGARRRSRLPVRYPEPPGLPPGHPHLGLRNRWYLVARSDEIDGRPRPVRLLGEDLVVWRTPDGRPTVMGDRCPHRGARLSQGDVVAAEIRCPYHHWTFDADGRCTGVPSQGGRCALSERTRVEPTYPATDAAGYLWAWIGDQPAGDLELPEELSDPGYSTFDETVRWETSWLLALENLADVMHAPFLHSRSLTLSRGRTEDRVLVTDTDGGFRVERKNQRGVNFDWVEIHLRNVVWTRLDIPYPSPWAAGPGPALRILGFLTPVDEHTTLVHFPRLRRVRGWQRAVWRALYRVRLRGTHLHVLNQDKRVLEGLRDYTRATRSERLAQADRPVVHLRRLLAPEFAAQMAAVGLEGTGLPVEVPEPGRRPRIPRPAGVTGA